MHGGLHGAHERRHLPLLAGGHGHPAIPKPWSCPLPLPRVVLGGGGSGQDGGDRAGGGLRRKSMFIAPDYTVRYDERVRDLLDFSIYLDISDEVKFAWKIQRDMAERGHSLESIKAGIEAKKPDFDAYIDTQKQYADAVIEVLPTQLTPDDSEGKVLRVKLIMKEGVKHFAPAYTISWIPCGRKLSCSYPGIRFAYGFGTYFGHEVSVLEMDGQFDRLDELIYVESDLSNLSTKFYGEVTQQMLKHADFPGSSNGTGLFQTIVGLKIRDLYEQIVAERAASPAEAAKVW